MTPSANIFNKLHFLVVLAILSFSMPTLAEEASPTADSQTLEDLLADPTAQTIPAVTHDSGKPAQKNSTSISFFDRIKNFFTFKSKQQIIKTVEAEKPSSQTQEDLEPFIDLGNNKLKAVVIDDTDKAGLADALKQSQNTQEVEKNKAIVSQTSVPAKDGAINASQSQASVTSPSVPVTPNAQEQNNTSQKNVSDASLPVLPVETNDTLVGSNIPDKQSASLPQPEVPLAAAKVTTDVQKSINNTDPATPATPALVTDQISNNDTPKLPEIPNNFGEDPKDVVVNQSKDVTSTQIKKASITSSKTKTNDAKDLSVKTSEAQNVKVPEFASNADVLSVPEVPSVPQDSFVALEPSQANGKARDANSGVGNLSDLSKFVIDEAKVLLLPNDDIVLGELTEAATFEQMDFQAYSKLYESQLERTNNYSKQLVIDNFLNSYDKNFNKVTILTNDDALDLAFGAVSKNNLFALRTLLDNNTLLQAKNNQGDTLLHASVELNNYYLTKFLIIRGINLTAQNDRGETPLAISEETGNTDISKLLKSAKASIK